MRIPKDCKTFKTYFYPDEWEVILEKSKTAELKPTTYIKRMVLNGEIKHFDVGTVLKLVKAINAYGNNLNQIAMVVNSTKSVYQSDVKKLLEDFHHMERDIEEYLKVLEYDKK